MHRFTAVSGVGAGVTALSLAEMPRTLGTETKNPQHLAGVRVIDKTLAEWTGLEPATPGVTGRYSNQLNYHSALEGAHCATRNPTAQ